MRLKFWVEFVPMTCLRAKFVLLHGWVLSRAQNFARGPYKWTFPLRVTATEMQGNQYLNRLGARSRILCIPVLDSGKAATCRCLCNKMTLGLFQSFSPPFRTKRRKDIGESYVRRKTVVVSKESEEKNCQSSLLSEFWEKAGRKFSFVVEFMH